MDRNWKEEGNERDDRVGGSQMKNSEEECGFLVLGQLQLGVGFFTQKDPTSKGGINTDQIGFKGLAEKQFC